MSTNSDHPLGSAGISRVRQLTFSRYLLAIALIAAAFGLRTFFGSMIPRMSPFLMFIPAVMLSAWFGGMGPGFLATAAGCVLGNYFLIGSGQEFDFDLSATGRTITFLVIGLHISWLSGRMKSAQRRALADATTARQTERLYRTLASNFPEGFVCLVDDTMRTTLAGTGLRLAGLDKVPDGTAFPRLWDGATAVIVEPLCAQAIKGVPASVDVPHRGRVYAAHFVPLPALPEGRSACMSIFEDITDRVAAIRELQWSRVHLEHRVEERTAELHFQKTLLESQSQASPDGILALSPQGKVIFANDRFRTLWGLPQKEVSLEEIRTVIRFQLSDHQDPLALESVESQPNVDNVDEFTLADGRCVEFRAAPIIDPLGKVFGVVCFFRDITERRRLQRLMLQAGERERQRIGQDLHDDLCQQLTGIACMGRLLHTRLTRLPVPEELPQSAATMVHMLQQANQRARELAQGLHPILLQRKGLDTALQELAASISSMHEITCRYCGPEQSFSADDSIALHLYRITQEAISNAIRHGKARTILVDVVSVDDRLILTIEDDGIGFSETTTKLGLGLESMSFRARMIGGTLAIERGESNGTCVSVCVPLALTAPPRALLHKETGAAHV